MGDLSELRARVKKLRKCTNSPRPGIPVTFPASTAMGQFFIKRRLGIVRILSIKSTDEIKWEMFRLPERNEPAATHYYVFSQEWRRGTINGAKDAGSIFYADTLAERLGKDDFKFLWTPEE